MTTRDPAPGCAFPSGVIHDHGNAACHAATATAAVQVFLEGIGAGEQITLCDNTQCRVKIYTVPGNAGRSIPICPGCYGSPS